MRTCSPLSHLPTPCSIINKRPSPGYPVAQFVQNSTFYCRASFPLGASWFDCELFHHPTSNHCQAGHTHSCPSSVLWPFRETSSTLLLEREIPGLPPTLSVWRPVLILTHPLPMPLRRELEWSSGALHLPDEEETLPPAK